LLLIKHGRLDVVKHTGLQNALELDASVEAMAGESKADELAHDLEKMAEDASVVRLVNQLVQEAINDRATLTASRPSGAHASAPVFRHNSGFTLN